MGGLLKRKQNIVTIATNPRSLKIQNCKMKVILLKIVILLLLIKILFSYHKKGTLHKKKKQLIIKALFKLIIYKRHNMKICKNKIKMILRKRLRKK